MGSVYLPNGYQVAFNCDAVVPRKRAEILAQAYADRHGKDIYVPDLGHFSPDGGSKPEPEPEPEPDPEAIKKSKARR
jgi:hypothetical protein|tara:strand:- start:2304 stop:2534 length:231 start_codon:yes stop_codon:yes gene_type:complete